MSQFDISIIFPTRGRLPLLEKTIDSIFGTAKFPEKIEVSLAYDSDDPDTKAKIVELQNKWRGMELVATEVYCDAAMAEAGINIHQQYFAPLARNSKAELVWEIGNDVVIITKHWDEILTTYANEFLDKHPDRLMYCKINHDSNVQTAFGFCCFPIISRAHILSVGCGVPQEITSWNSDLFLWQIYKHLCEDRILDLSDKIEVQHLSYHSKRYHEGKEVKETDPQPDEWRGDEISYRLRTNVRELTQQQFAWYVNKLNERILKYK